MEEWREFKITHRPLVCHLFRNISVARVRGKKVIDYCR
jgi:hypothetical protein